LGIVGNGYVEKELIMKRLLLVVSYFIAIIPSFAQCGAVQSLNSTQNSQLNGTFSALKISLEQKNLNQIDSLNAAGKLILSTEAGLPETAETYTTLSGNTTWLSASNAITLSRLLIASDSIVYVNTPRICKGELPPLYQPHSVPLRAGAEICSGLIRIANAETDPTRRNLYMQWATDGLDTLLTMQLPNGAFPFPDLRTYGDPVFTPIINNFLQSLGADSVNVLVNGWIIDDRGTGEFKFDAGVIGAAFAEAFLFTGDTNYRNAAILTASYCDTLPMNTNYNYNSFQACALSFGYRLAPQNSDWNLNTDTLLRYSVLPGQISNGRWMDGHNARSVYHNIIIHNSALALSNCAASNPHFDTLALMLNSALRNFLSDYYVCGASVGFDGLLRAYRLGNFIVPVSLHDSIGDVIGNYINRAANDGAFLDVYTMGLYLDAQFNLSGINENESDYRFTIFPNPGVNDVLYIQPGSLLNNAQTISVYHSSGAIVFEQKYFFAGDRIPISIPANGWSSGIYFVQITDGINTYRHRWMKMN
jgi:hypothetical protein